MEQNSSQYDSVLKSMTDIQKGYKAEAPSSSSSSQYDSVLKSMTDIQNGKQQSPPNKALQIAGKVVGSVADVGIGVAKGVGSMLFNIGNIGKDALESSSDSLLSAVGLGLSDRRKAARVKAGKEVEDYINSRLKTNGILQGVGSFGSNFLPPLAAVKSVSLLTKVPSIGRFIVKNPKTAAVTLQGVSAAVSSIAADVLSGQTPNRGQIGRDSLAALASEFAMQTIGVPKLLRSDIKSGVFKNTVKGLTKQFANSLAVYGAEVGAGNGEGQAFAAAVATFVLGGVGRSMTGYSPHNAQQFANKIIKTQVQGSTKNRLATTFSKLPFEGKTYKAIAREVPQFTHRAGVEAELLAKADTKTAVDTESAFKQLENSIINETGGKEAYIKYQEAWGDALANVRKNGIEYGKLVRGNKGKYEKSTKLLSDATAEMSAYEEIQMQRELNRVIKNSFVGIDTSASLKGINTSWTRGMVNQIKEQNPTLSEARSFWGDMIEIEDNIFARLNKNEGIEAGKFATNKNGERILVNGPKAERPVKQAAWAMAQSSTMLRGALTYSQMVGAFYNFSHMKFSRAQIRQFMDDEALKSLKDTIKHNSKEIQLLLGEGRTGYSQVFTNPNMVDNMATTVRQKSALNKIEWETGKKALKSGQKAAKKNEAIKARSKAYQVKKIKADEKAEKKGDSMLKGLIRKSAKKVGMLDKKLGKNKATLDKKLLTGLSKSKADAIRKPRPNEIFDATVRIAVKEYGMTKSEAINSLIAIGKESRNNMTKGTARMWLSQMKMKKQ